MSKKITLKHEDREYTLTFTKRTLEDACNMGITPDNLTHNPMKVVRLFHQAFMAMQPKMTFNKAQEIYFAQNKKEKLIEALIMLWNDVTDSIVEDADDSGNVAWAVNFEMTKDETAQKENSEEE